MSVAVDLDLTPGLDEVRELAREHNLVPLRHTFIADIETPVSAYLKLRGDGPSFLLESAEQGQRVGRWTFLGFRPRATMRMTLGDHPDACRRSRAEPSACSGTTSCARPSRRSARRTRTRPASPTSR
jgi:anthranilate/para-aminobenzoate synthase component I